MNQEIFSPVNTAFKNEDLELWKKYKATNSPIDLSNLLKRLDPIIQSTVNKWAGPVSRDVLLNEAKLLAKKAFDTYDPNKGTALASHVVTNLAPISRIVYTYQNVARLPENITLKLNTYNTTVDNLASLHGREPTTDELHQELGWSAKELNKLKKYQVADLVESGQKVKEDLFFNDKEDSDTDVLHALYFDLLPEEKKLFELITGLHSGRPHSNPEIMKETGYSQAQLSYKKTMLSAKIDKFMNQRSRRKK